MAQTYKFGNGTWATKKGSTLAYSDTNNNFKPLPFSFERNSIGTRVNKEGLIEVVGNDIPRIDYTDSTEGALLLENSATNLLTYSEDFAQGYFNQNGGTLVASNSVISPNGTQDADKITKTTTDIWRGLTTSNITLQASTTYIASCFVKKGDGVSAGVNVAFGGAKTLSLNSKIVFSNETIDNREAIGSWDNTGFEKFENGWYRVWGEFTTGTSVNTTSMGVVIDGDVISNKFNYFYGLQIEEGSYPTSYIPTNGSTVQRAAETCNGSGNSEVFNNVEGTIFIDTNFKNSSGVQIICCVHDFATNKRLEIWANSNLINGFIGGSSNITVGSSNLINGSHKIALNYKSGNSSFYVDGFLIGSSSTTFTIAELTKMTLGYYNATQYQSESPTKEIGYYDEILTDLELETLTSYRSLNELVTELNLNTL